MKFVLLGNSKHINPVDAHAVAGLPAQAPKPVGRTLSGWHLRDMSKIKRQRKKLEVPLGCNLPEAI